ncbi:MAG TPA: hypothetical protein VFJ51_06350 [Nitrososphaeraceae archaeon]|nr:hypothetical protein [Nitrososphaeraceae archaeon]
MATIEGEIVIDTEGKSVKEFNGLPNTHDQSQTVDTLDFEFSL